MRLPIQVLVYPVRWREGAWQYLLLHRIARNGAFWQGVTGGVEAGENLQDAALRDLREETRFEPLTMESLSFFYSYPLAPRWAPLYAPGVDTIVEHTFLARVADGIEPSIDPNEHDAYAWCLFDEALGRLIWPENRDALSRAAARLRAAN